jgi:hypothetical protein
MGSKRWAGAGKLGPFEISLTNKKDESAVLIQYTQVLSFFKSSKLCYEPATFHFLVFMDSISYLISHFLISPLLFDPPLCLQDQRDVTLVRMWSHEMRVRHRGIFSLGLLTY